MSRIVRLLWKRFLLSIAESMHDRLDFTIELLTQLLVIILNVTFFTVVYQHVPSLGGYSYEQALLILGLYQLMDGISNFVLRNNVRYINKYVRLGEFDSMLTQPVDTQLNILRRFSITQLGVIAASVGIIGYAAALLMLPLSQLLIAVLIAMLLGFLLHWAVMFGISTLGFWLIKMDHLAHLAMAILDLGKFPIGAYGARVGSFLTFVVPLAIVATIPAQLIFGEPVWHLVAITAIVILALFALSRAFFFWTLRSYSSVSG